MIPLLATFAAVPDGRLEWRISQGEHMGRPSLLVASAEKQGGKVVAAFIGGSCVSVMNGVLTLG